MIGFYKLINADKILRSYSSSIHTVGPIALATLLSPRHTSHSVSLYNEFKEWIAVNNCVTSSFIGFVSNRFGRILEIANEFMKYREALTAFFEVVVNENANKLILAAHTLIRLQFMVPVLQ
jgi:hypothetical protein